MKTIILDGYKFTKTGNKKYHYNSTLRKYLHQYIWEKENGSIPKGYEIHHIDQNTDNNSIENLCLLSIKEHQEIHKELSWNEERRERARNNLNKKARPKAKEWHRSEKGKEWHKKHYERMKDKLFIEKEFECEYCKKKYKAINNNTNRFCSNKCKSAWRRKSGIDDVEKVCEICGSKFKTNKYSKTKTCSRSCANRLKSKLKDSPNL